MAKHPKGRNNVAFLQKLDSLQAGTAGRLLVSIAGCEDLGLGWSIDGVMTLHLTVGRQVYPLFLIGSDGDCVPPVTGRDPDRDARTIEFQNDLARAFHGGRARTADKVTFAGVTRQADKYLTVPELLTHWTAMRQALETTRARLLAPVTPTGADPV